MDYETGHKIWMQYIQPALDAHPHVTALAPAVTGETSGFQWMQNFTNICDGHCTVRVIFAIIHWP